MFCWKCGEENPEGAKFCRKCGAGLSGTAQSMEDGSLKNETIEAGSSSFNAATTAAGNTTAAVSGTAPGGSKKKLFIGIGIAAAATAVIAIVAGISLGKRPSENGSGTVVATSAQTSAGTNQEKSTFTTDIAQAEGNYKVGDTVILGSYEQDNNFLNFSEPIEWQVIGTRDGHTLLLSKYALDCKRYNESDVDIFWKNCTLRSWLNDDFYYKAFSASDRKKIVTAHNKEVFGNATDDKVFLLSETEARDYLDGKIYNYGLGAGNYNQKLLCRPTAYAKAQGVETYYNSDNDYPSDTAGCCIWWLRELGTTQYGASIVNSVGALGSTGTSEDIYRGEGVRPAILIDSENDNGNNTQSSTEKTQSNNKDSTNQVNGLHRDPAYDLFGDTTAR